MSEWKTYKWGDLISLEYGKPIPDKNLLDGQYPVYGTNGRIGTSNLTPLCKHPSIIVGRKGAYRGVHYSNKPFSVIDTAFFVEPKTSILDLKWAYYKLLTVNINKMDSGSAIPSTDRYEIYSLSVELPSLDEQRRIAGILGSLDDKIELNRRINANLEAQAQALFRSWFVDNETQNNNPGFFNDIIQTTLSGDWGQETPKGNYISEVYCIRGADIPDIKCGDKGKLPTRYILEKNLKNKKLSENDLVVEISGGSPTQSTGRICLITRALLDRLGKDVICTNFCRALKPIPDYSFFIYLYWQYLYNNNTMFSYENGTTGIKNLNITDFINKEPITIPGKKKILEFNKVLQPIFDMIYKNGRESEYLSALRDTLLPKLMAGEINLH